MLNDCLAEVAFLDQPEIISMAVTKNSEYKYVFSKFINQMKLNGIMDRITKFYDINEECNVTKNKALGKLFHQS